MKYLENLVKALVQVAILETDAPRNWRTSHDQNSIEMRACLINVLNQEKISQKHIASLLSLKPALVSKWIHRFESYQDENIIFANTYANIDQWFILQKHRAFYGCSIENTLEKTDVSTFAIDIKKLYIMKLIEMINQNPDKFQETLQESLRLMSDLVEKLREEPEVEKFMSAEFVLLNGAHFNADNVKSFVGPMTHRDAEGNQVEGELITIEEVKERLPEEFHEVNLWDAYVGINEMLHRLARTSLDRDQIIEVAIEYWLRDDRYEQPSEKVWKTLN